MENINDNKIKILAIDDEMAILDLVVSSLTFAGFTTDKATNASKGLELASSVKYDLIVCDVMLPDFNGFTLVQRLRDMQIFTPVIFLTARDDVEHKIQGLTVGGDDYMEKPFSIEELIARVKAILRRSQMSDLATSGNKQKNQEQYFMQVQDLKLFPDSHEVLRDGAPIELSKTEFRLLEYLMENKEHVMSKQQILEHVWQYDWSSDFAVIETYISYLRKKVDYDVNKPKLIQTKRGIGYMVK